MITIRDIMDFTESFAPLSTAADFDNCGLLVGSPLTSVSKVLLALDITPEVISEAADMGAELILSHHPVIFNPLRSLDTSSPAYLLASNGVAALCLHTNLDIAATKLREKFSLLSLPDGAIDPIIVNMNLSDMIPTAMVALIGEDLAAAQTLAEDVVVPALERIDGVASVSISGGITEQISVDVDSARAAGYGLSNSYIIQFS